LSLEVARFDEFWTVFENLGTICISVPRPPVSLDRGTGTGDGVVHAPIAPTQLEVVTSSGWFEIILITEKQQTVDWARLVRV